MTISESDVFYQLLGWTPPETVMQYCPRSHTVSASPLCEREQNKMGMSTGVGGGGVVTNLGEVSARACNPL